MAIRQRVGSLARRPAIGVLAIGLALCLAAPASAGPIGATGDVYVSDGYVGGVFQYDGETGAWVPGNYSNIYATGMFAVKGNRTFGGNTWGSDGNLYAVSNANPNRWDVDMYDGSTGALIQTVVPHLNDGSASVGMGITFGPDGDLYVGDWFRARIDRYQAGTFAPKASYAAVPGDNLGTPTGMTIAPDGNLLVISGGYNKVLQFDTSANGLSLLGTFADLGNSQQPRDLTFGPNGNLFVTGGGTAFGGGGNVMEFDGTTGAYLSDFVPTLNTQSTEGLVFDNYGRLLVSVYDATNGYRVRMFDATTGDPLGDFYPPGAGGGGWDGSPYYMSIKPVPEPATIGLLLVGGAFLPRRRARGGAGKGA
jgi:WD40 repeat protein